MIKKAKKSLSVLLAVFTVLTALTASIDFSSVKADAASWNGTNYGGGSVSGYRTFLEAFGIDYDTYMKWMDDHDKNSPNPDYYIGTRYVAYDHRNPHGDCKGAYSALDVPGSEGLNCTGFVWHVLYKSAYHSGASRSQLNSLPVMGNVVPTWANLGVYRIYFPTKQAALDSGILEKGDLLWIYGTKDNHNAIFYGDNPHHDRFWHSAGPNCYGRINACGEFLGMWVAKVTQPNKMELHINENNPNNSGGFGAKYCVFDSKEKAEAAKKSSAGSAAWDSRIGTIALDGSGCGTFRIGSAPSKSELWKNGRPQTGLSYFSAAAKKVDSSKTYYAVQWSPAAGAPVDTEIYTFSDSGKRTSTGYRIYNFKTKRTVATPEITELKSTEKGVKIRWNKVDGTYKYRIYYKGKNGWVRMGETPSANFVDEIVSYGSTYTYTVRCVDKDGEFISDYNKNGWKHTYTGIATPQITGVFEKPDGINIKWTPVQGAAKYRVYSKTNGGGWNKIGETDSAGFIDDTVLPGNIYTYTIRCLNGKGCLISGYDRDGKSCQINSLPEPIINGIESKIDGLLLSWKPVEGAAKYRLYFKNSRGGWSSLGDTAETSFLDDNVTAGHSYIYTIRCLNSSGRLISGYYANGWTGTYIGVNTPRITSLVAASSGVKISWAPVNGAKLYRVFYKGRNNWVKLGDTNGNTYLDTDVRDGGKYTYTVRCVGEHNNYISSFDANGSTIQYHK